MGEAVLLIGWHFGQLHILPRQITAIVLLENPAIIISLQMLRTGQPVLIVPDLAVMRRDAGLKRSRHYVAGIGRRSRNRT